MLKVDKLSFAYGKKEVLKDLSFQLKEGEILAVMGPSGCGKSTLLHLLAGLRRGYRGTITSSAQKIAYAFQEPRLFPWLTVAENLRAVVTDRKVTDEEIYGILREIGLEDTQRLYPSELSGGMRSRVSLARAMLYGGDLYLFDEPFAALDEKARRELTVWLRQKIRETGASAIFVTHQKGDAEAMADRILELH